MSLCSLLLLTTVLPAQPEATSGEPSSWSAGVAVGMGFGFFLGTDRLEAELLRVQRSMGEPGNVSLDERPVRAPSATLRVFVDRALLDELGVGLDLSLFFWDPRGTRGFNEMLREEYGVETVAAQGSAAAARLGPRLVGRWPLVPWFAAELAVAGGLWLDLSSRFADDGGWYVRPTAALAWQLSAQLGLRFDAGYVYMPAFGRYPDPLRGVELEVGAAWQL